MRERKINAMYLNLPKEMKNVKEYSETLITSRRKH
jgi:hypothetical protein